MSERYSIIFMGNPYEFVVRDNVEHNSILFHDIEEKPIRKLVIRLNEQSDEIKRLREELRLALN